MKKVHYLQLKEIKDQNLLLEIFIKVLPGQDIYKSIEEKAANFLYLIVKNYVFTDGNKRIAPSDPGAEAGYDGRTNRCCQRTAG